MAESAIMLLAATMIMIWWATPSQAIWLSLPSSGTKCVSEEIHNNVVVLLDYSLVLGGDDDPSHPTTISVRVSSPYGQNLYYQEKVTKGQSAFTTSESGAHVACFWLDGNHEEGAGRTIDIDWKIGITAKDWDSVAKKEKIEGVEFELRKLEGIVNAIHENIIFLKEREAKMREVSETTNSRVAWFSLMSLGVCIVVAALQLWHLQHFFRKKKLI
ncbi:transmembrane emp24 domain-containing protein p24delta5-like [Vitis riparia]|uniref:transmembrane emp24 domain-containing protein p24delta5-like n=1 Tax=Vitis riparia TaxID=96939 RepID=UPI00155AE28B|nr:transmembrane emp24 domain-containing protein p24delta5-like [Vitis riparia]XP_034675975.1 transmembrane emp24 domain-containing protein p24delta5-like [Vitis riparia]